jgi:hypothetical protein
MVDPLLMANPNSHEIVRNGGVPGEVKTSKLNEVFV